MESIIHHPFAYPVAGIQVTGFGLAVLLAFVCSQYIAERELARRGHDPSPIPDLIIAAVVGGLLGAKLYYVLVVGSIDEFFTRAGFVFWGGLIGGIAAVLIVIWHKKLNVPRIADVGGICIAAAYSIGRTGCWAVGDDYGIPWNSPLAVQFPNGAPPSTARVLNDAFSLDLPADVLTQNPVLAVHPTQIYEVVMGFGMFLILWRLRNHRHAEGWLFGMYCVLAGVERFIIEFFRAKDDRFFGAFTAAQLISVLFVAVGIVILMARSNIGPGRPGIFAAQPVPRAAKTG